MEMASAGLFECRLCGLSAPYGYVGRRPPDSRSVVLLEESYVTRDPFAPGKDKFLVVGSRCGLCDKPVCAGPGCSLFYSKRFCLPCTWENIDAFPREIRHDLEKKRAETKPSSKKPDSRT
ncbi:cysteine-rich DPF motif domain-containing protein 1 isoform X2 [Ornithorhynchus anatinus]|uniref:cysteine-rich DPF motif domain-containing protein 1 isoform X2 n=1 Tax=Ornithorhynchus anatinus TaxID=9258 RepID=UPI00022400C4|nr:cysteine-rich DPF motif domain-containing protein 1 isoform X2 [Ornithorhynchus anatinus]